MILAVYAAEDILTDAGTVVFISFDIVGRLGDSSVIRLSDFQCNEAQALGGFYAENTVSGKECGVSLHKAVRITVSAEEDLMQYDMDNDRKIGLRDALRAIVQGNLKAAVRALQVVSGIK